MDPEGRWERGMAVLELQKFTETELSPSEILVKLKVLESPYVHIIAFTPPHFVHFEKKGVDFDFVGRQMERWLFAHFRLKK